MGLKVLKYIFLYLIFVFLISYIYGNRSFFVDFLKNHYSYVNFFNLKKQKVIYFSGTSLENIKISKSDRANLELIDEKIKNAKDSLENLDEHSYKDFYNLGNLSLLDSYNQFKKSSKQTDGKGLGKLDVINQFIGPKNSLKDLSGSIDKQYVKEAESAVKYYNQALSLSPESSNKTYILENLKIGKSFLNFLYYYECDKIFLFMIKKNDELLSFFPKIEKVLIQQFKSLKKREKNKDLRQCINEIKKANKKNIEMLKKNKIFFEEILKSLDFNLKYFQKKPMLCYKQVPVIKNKYLDSILSSIEYFKSFNKKQKDLLKIFEEGKKADIELLCDNRKNLKTKQQNENKKMKENLNNLNDLREKSQKNKKKQEEERKKQENQKQENQKQEGKNKTNSNQQNQENKEGRRNQEKLENLKKQNNSVIEQIQKNKTQKNYRPLKYIEELFKEFYGNDKDFKSGKKRNDDGK